MAVGNRCSKQRRLVQTGRARGWCQRACRAVVANGTRARRHIGWHAVNNNLHSERQNIGAVIVCGQNACTRWRLRCDAADADIASTARTRGSRETKRATVHALGARLALRRRGQIGGVRECADGAWRGLDGVGSVAVGPNWAWRGRHHARHWAEGANGACQAPAAPNSRLICARIAGNLNGRALQTIAASRTNVSAHCLVVSGVE